MTAAGEPQVTLQLCTFKRAHVLGRVLDACFEQTYASAKYEVVLVNDGSPDDTQAVIQAARARATCAFIVIDQVNAGLAKARNVGISRARGERIIFIDDDVLVTPSFIEEHMRSHARSPSAVVRGAVINTPSFERLPPPVWSMTHYSGNFFWTTNVSVPLATLRAVGAFTESFREYGWEDIELGMRLRAAGVRGVFNRDALAYHYKPLPRRSNVAAMVRQARSQARTAVQLAELHPHWRVALSTGDNVVQRLLYRAARTLRVSALVERVLPGEADDPVLTPAQRLAAQTLVSAAYFDELEKRRRSDDYRSLAP